MSVGTVTRTALPLLGAALCLVLPEHRLFAYGQLLAYLAAVAGLSVLVGACGQVSFGHAGLLAVGGYAMAFTQNWLYGLGFTVAPPVRSSRFAAAAEPVAAPWTLPVSLLAGVAAALVVGALLGWAAAKLRGPYLAGLTLAFGLVVLPLASLVDALGGEPGFSVHVPAATPRARAWVALAGAGLVLVLLGRLLHSRLGRRMRAVRDDEVAAGVTGVPVAGTRVLAFVASAGAAGLAGGLYVFLTGTVLPGYFGLTLSLYLVLAVVVGGPGSLPGAAAGTLFVVAVPLLCSAAVAELDVSPAVAARLAGNLPLLLFGLALVVAPGLRRGRGTYENGPAPTRASPPTRGRSRTP